MMLPQVLALAVCLTASPVAGCGDAPAAPLEDILRRAGLQAAVAASPEWAMAASGTLWPVLVPRLRGRLASGELHLAFAARPALASDATAKAADEAPLQFGIHVGLPVADATALEALLVSRLGPPSLARRTGDGATLLWCENCGTMAAEEVAGLCHPGSGIPVNPDRSATCGRIVGMVWRPAGDGMRLELWGADHVAAGAALRAAMPGGDAN